MVVSASPSLRIIKKAVAIRSAVVICGGVGAARFLSGLCGVMDPSAITAIVNVGDDVTFHGLHVSPDIDTVLYTLAGLVDPEHGWGIGGDTYRTQAALARLGRDTWFNLGDADLATHIHRTARLREGAPLSTVTAELRSRLGVGPTIIPATDDALRTMIRTDEGWLAFQEYFVRQRTRATVHEVRFDGAARAAPGCLEAIAAADAVLIAPSNPIVSIAPVLAVDGMRDAIVRSPGPVIAVSPIVGGEAIKGPAAAMLASLGHEISPVGVTRIYRDLIDVMVLDERDAAFAPAIAALGVRPVVTQTIMADRAAKEALARTTLNAALAHASA